ncbi:TMAO reductase system periplasmic protein TorT (plasmid) [Shinella sp. PSBB067]|uniref:TMAO reductase system periplasmic protein TorT n=1 Tax=Shinella sp. PSBB067 TaxID=2715959 RepID=UPI00193C2BA9|nr:TMAO reductase system periplasmic protein TorT [Shinella sp. PSBB067]QRI61521.1 TMAO reductase system periplasmic protein TorT [Shinella sp. PSBB067]
MKTDWSCLSKRLARMKHAYRRSIHAAIAIACVFFGGAATAGDLCVLVPHFKDEYWLSVAYGIEARAKEKGLTVHFFEAGGYRALSHQVEQIAACEGLNARAILIGAVSSDDGTLLAAVSRAAMHRPVIGLVNELHSDALMARVGVDWSLMGAVIGKHLARTFPAGMPPRHAVLLTGPRESGWTAPLEAGLRSGLEGSALSIDAVLSADTGNAEQLRILEKALAGGSTPDVIVGSAPAIEAAMALHARAGSGPLLIATYISHSVARGLVNGSVAAVPFDNPMLQGRWAVEAAVTAMGGVGRPEPIGPPIELVTKGISPSTLKMSPADYFPSLD